MFIDSYSFGKILIEGQTFNSDLILFPDHIQENWRRQQGHYLQKKDLAGIEKISRDLLIIGTGAQGAMKVAQEVAEWLDFSGIKWERLRTAKACDKYNSLVKRGKLVIAALHLTC